MKILYYPHELLTTPTKPVIKFDKDLKEQIYLMFKIMREAKGIGLAANQVGIDNSVFVMDVPLDKNNSLKRAFINPTITGSGEKISLNEGCLSFPGVLLEVSRMSIVEITYQNLFQQVCKETFTNLPAIVCQHETDHLDGKTFIDDLDLLTRETIRAKLSSK